MPNKRYATRDGEGFSALEAKKAEPVESAAKYPGEPNGLERLLTTKEMAAAPQRVLVGKTSDER
jgi:hypothetical protein